MHQWVDNFSTLRSDAISPFLRLAKIFSTMAGPDLRDLADAAVMRTLTKGAYLFHKGEVVPGLCLVRRGTINFHRVAPDGKEIVISFYREGETFAEFAAAHEVPSLADARALGPSEVIIIPRRAFLGKIRTYPELALRLVSSLNDQFLRFADSLEDVVSKNASGRFVHWLLRQCKGSSNGSVDIDLSITKKALAGELGVRQETLSRVLRKFSDSGHVHVREGRITLNDPAALRMAWAE